MTPSSLRSFPLFLSLHRPMSGGFRLFVAQSHMALHAEDSQNWNPALCSEKIRQTQMRRVFKIVCRHCRPFLLVERHRDSPSGLWQSPTSICITKKPYGILSSTNCGFLTLRVWTYGHEDATFCGISHNSAWKQNMLTKQSANERWVPFLRL